MDLTIKNIPDDINKEEIINFISILIQRKEAEKIKPTIEQINNIKIVVDNFQKDNILAEKI